MNHYPLFLLGAELVGIIIASFIEMCQPAELYDEFTDVLS